MRRNVSDDWDMLKETKLLMYSIRGNHGYVTETNIFSEKTNNFDRIFRKILLFNFLNISIPKKTFSETKFFLGT